MVVNINTFSLPLCCTLLVVMFQFHCGLTNCISILGLCVEKYGEGLSARLATATETESHLYKEYVCTPPLC